MTIGTMTLTASTPLAVRAARQALAVQLDRWECGRAPDALLVFSELVTNAVEHAGGATRILVVHGQQMVQFEVHDDAHGVPTVADPAGPVRGYGLHVVDRLSERWGWNETPTGKVVWCAILCCVDDDG